MTADSVASSKVPSIEPVMRAVPPRGQRMVKSTDALIGAGMALRRTPSEVRAAELVRSEDKPTPICSASSFSSSGVREPLGPVESLQAAAANRPALRTNARGRRRVESMEESPRESIGDYHPADPRKGP